MAQNAWNFLIQREMQKKPKLFKNMHRYGMLIFIHHNLLNTIFRKKTNSGLATSLSPNVLPEQGHGLRVGRYISLIQRKLFLKSKYMAM